jgi:phage gp36-like protein
MAYASAQDALLRYPKIRVAEMTDTAEPPPLPGEDPAARELLIAKLAKERRKRLDAALEDASAEIDSYLGRVASLPLASPPAILKRFAIEIGVYRLMVLLNKESVEDARRRYEDIVKWLEAVVAGEIALEGITDAVGSGNVAWSAPARVFDANGLKGFHP